jgi:RNA polymerase sigma-70 factor (ECF subfamily)
MGDGLDATTSLTLLRLLGGPDRDEKAWGRFCDRYEPLIGRWCRRWPLQPADVEDMTQDVLIRVFNKINTFKPGLGGFRGWLKTVVENAVKDFLRTRRRHPGDQGSGDSDFAELLPPAAGSETVDALVQELDSSLRRDMEGILARVEQQIEPETMRAFRMTFLEGRPIADAAAELGKSYAAVCMAINRVKKKLRAAGTRLSEREANSEGETP